MGDRRSIVIDAAMPAGTRALFDDSLIAQLDTLLHEFAARRSALLAARQQRHQRYANGKRPAMHEDQDIVPVACDVPTYLGDRRVQLQIAANSETLLRAVNADVSAILISPRQALDGRGALDAQQVLHEVIAAQASAKRAAMPALIYAPRSLDVVEPLLHWHDEAVPAALLDALLFVVRYRESLERLGQVPCLHLAGVDSPEEAEFWADVLRHLEHSGISGSGTIRTSIGMDTVNANFSLQPIIEALRDYIVSVETDHFAYLRSFIHTFQHLPQFVLPDRNELTAGSHFLRAQGIKLLRTAHQFGIHAIASCTSALAEQTGEGSNTLQWLRSEIEREARDGFDGCSIADPEIIELVNECFDDAMPGQHQKHRMRDDANIFGADLLQVVKGKITEEGLRHNIQLALLGAAGVSDPDIANTLRGAEASTSSIELAADQLWQWLWLDTGVLDDGRIIDEQLLAATVEGVTGTLNVAPEPLQAAVQRLSAHLARRDLATHFLADDN